MTWDRPLLTFPVGWLQGRGYGQRSACGSPQRTCSDPYGGQKPSHPPRNTREDTCWQTHTHTQALCSVARLPRPRALIGVGMGHKGGQGQGWSQAGSPTCLPVQEARPWLQAVGLPIGHLQRGALPLPLLFIRAGPGGRQRGVRQAHPGQVGDLERRQKEGWGP